MIRQRGKFLRRFSETVSVGAEVTSSSSSSAAAAAAAAVVVVVTVD